MPLPILQSRDALSAEDFVRMFQRTELHWSRHLGEETELEVGTAICNAELTDVPAANCIMAGMLPEGVSPSAVVAIVDAHFSTLGARCLQWTPNPSAAVEGIAPLAQYLQANGWETHVEHIFRACVMPEDISPPSLDGLTLIPARASFRHARALAIEAVLKKGGPMAVEARLLHLDDPHYDALLALDQGVCVASVGMLAVGDVGRLVDLYVSESHRRRGIGGLMVRRALEIGARSLFRHVIAGIESADIAGESLLKRMGFGVVGRCSGYRRPPL